MAIHATVAKRAVKMKVELIEHDQPAPGGRFRASWGKGMIMHGNEAKFLLDDVQALINMERDFKSFDWDLMEDDTVEITVKGTAIEVKGLRAAAAFELAKKMWIESRAELDIDDEEADAEVEEEIDAEIEEEGKNAGGSVVGSRYRARYAEMGHPTHCGDWLAFTLKNITTNKEGVNVPMLDAIADLNGIDISKYRREGHGWQGRLRMTTGNLLRRVIWLADGILHIPDGVLPEQTTLKAPGEWMAEQKFKRPKPAKAADTTGSTPEEDAGSAAEPDKAAA